MINWVSILSGFVGLIVGWLIRIFWERRKIELEHKLQIMREMTTTFHELSHKHYVPLGQAAYDLKKTLARGDKGECSFFRLVKFLRQYDKLPILQLKCSLAEDTFLIVAGRIQTLISDEGEFSEEELSELQEGDISEKLAGFIENIKTSSQLQHVFNKYVGLITKRGSELEELMQCLSDIIFMEVSCGKEPWYKREELHKQADETLKRLNGLNCIDNTVKSEATNYYKKLLGMYK